MPFSQNDTFKYYFLGDTEEEALERYKQYEGIIRTLAYKYASFGADPEDLFQEGLIGLARAVKLFDENRSSGEKNFKILALYYIKNAMRDFATKQSLSLKIPQYLKDAMYLFDILKELLYQSGEDLSSLSLFEIFTKAETRECVTELDRKILDTVSKIVNLAGRASTTPPDLISRLDILPLELNTLEEYNQIGYIYDYENQMLNNVHSNTIVNWLGDILTEDEFTLLWEKHVEKLTMNELSEKYGVSSMTIYNRLKKIIKKIHKLDKKRKRLCNNENNTNSEEVS